ncbi:hypothetical protein CR513_40675, partial [Mucuna pruriens]
MEGNRRLQCGNKMGNCLRHESWMGYSTEEEEEEIGSFASSNGVKKATREVKIKITKKQLEELVGKVEEVKELRVEHVLAHLIKHSLHRPWRPALQSIPED